MKAILLASLLAISVIPAFAADAPAAKPKTAQQQKMTDCNAQAAGKKGAERKTFMSSCLKSGAAEAPVAKAKTPQQQKMADCNTQAAGKKGAERKTFMSSCLKG